MGIVLTVIPTLAPTPAMNLPTIINAVEFPNGEIELHKMYQTQEKPQIFLRPFISDTAAIKKGPNASPKKNVEKMICTVDELTDRSRAI